MPDETRRSVLLRLSAGLSLAAANPVLATLSPEPGATTATAHDLAGIWRSTYTYYSSGRGEEFTGEHFVVLRHSSDGLTGHSLPIKENSELDLHPIGRHARVLLLDLAGVSFCDARGLSALVRIANHADRAG